jgi:hypothetical protein
MLDFFTTLITHYPRFTKNSSTPTPGVLSSLHLPMNSHLMTIVVEFGDLLKFYVWSGIWETAPSSRAREKAHGRHEVHLRRLREKILHTGLFHFHFYFGLFLYVFYLF